MFAKIVALFALLAVGFAAPNPKPQLVAYSSGLDYVYPGAVPSYGSYGSYVSPLTYSAPVAPAPVAYSGLPANAVYFR